MYKEQHGAIKDAIIKFSLQEKTIHLMDPETKMSLIPVGIINNFICIIINDGSFDKVPITINPLTGNDFIKHIDKKPDNALIVSLSPETAYIIGGVGLAIHSKTDKKVHYFNLIPVKK
jgi:hypothetical protein